jgi:hypothetical protein
MKITSILYLLLVFLITACNKSANVNKEPIDKTLTGKWTYTEYFFSTGSPGSWHPVSPANQTIEFKADGTFMPAESFLKTANRFEMVDSVTIKFQPASTATGYILMGYQIKTAERELYLYPVNPLCIEGCSNKFIK